MKLPKPTITTCAEVDGGPTESRAETLECIVG